jgi:hypothetical protein
VRLEVSDAGVNINEEEEDGDVDDGWTKTDDLRNLERILGNWSHIYTR